MSGIAPLQFIRGRRVKDDVLSRERRPEWIDMVQHAARDNRVEGPGVIELFERQAPVKGPLGSFGVDADHVVARGRQTGSCASFVATAHFEQATWWLRQL